MVFWCFFAATHVTDLLKILGGDSLGDDVRLQRSPCLIQVQYWRRRHAQPRRLADRRNWRDVGAFHQSCMKSSWQVDSSFCGVNRRSYNHYWTVLLTTLHVLRHNDFLRRLLHLGMCMRSTLTPTETPILISLRQTVWQSVRWRVVVSYPFECNGSQPLGIASYCVRTSIWVYGSNPVGLELSSLDTTYCVHNISFDFKLILYDFLRLCPTTSVRLFGSLRWYSFGSWGYPDTFRRWRFRLMF